MSDVTVIVTTYERPAWLRVALHSITAAALVAHEQGITTEVLVVDDGHTLAGADAVRGLGYGYVATGHVGSEQARMAGLECITSTYLAFFDDDDFMLPGFIASHVAKAEEGFDVVSGSYYETDAALRPTILRQLRPASLPDLLAGIVSANDFSLVRRSALSGVRFHPERERVFMMSLWLDLAAKGARFAALPEPQFFYRQHAGNRHRDLDARDAALRREAIAEYAGEVAA